ncbi:hypothetical protein Cri9333_3103 [Crinalium epipsammum PCC 9333]|uniref:Arc-like DNA binding domain-containing protein n=1 Tax=Crinalium epipsammum PCC 9333 TaxID=1173022 RepID=K9W142_9CYAN|nr:hypothetical protein [Crinalium epipsammum]AFZ13941.1 hypothetical protein Cri9333_3103 [Crinalium epipsammum PCC 9333]
MAKLTIDHLPDELMEQIQQLANQNHQTIDEQLIKLLKQALQKPQQPLKFIASPEIDPTWEERCKAVPQLLADIDKCPRLNPLDYGLPDSTELIREDRQR